MANGNENINKRNGGVNNNNGVMAYNENGVMKMIILNVNK